jgi:hypothetical protein
MCNHLNLKILIHTFTVIYLIMIIIIMRGENFLAHRCAAEHRFRITGLSEGYDFIGLLFHTSESSKKWSCHVN